MTIQEYVSTLTTAEKVKFAPLIQECMEREVALEVLSKACGDLAEELNVLNIGLYKNLESARNLNARVVKIYENLQGFYLAKAPGVGSC
jgi:hypothetical protein